MLILATLLLLGQFVPPVRTGVAGEPGARITPKPIAFPADAAWQRASTPRFDIISAAGERRTREIGQRLESLAGALQQLRPTKSEAPRTRVILFANRREAQPYFDVLTSRDNARVSGIFVGQRSSGAMIIDASRDLAGDRTPYHELVHYLLGGNRLPLWLEEGLAEFYSNAELGTNELTVGWPMLQHVQLLNRRGAIPPSQLFAMKFESEAAAQPLFYAESWAIVDYLIAIDRVAFSAFLTDVTNGTPAEDALRTRFGLKPPDVLRIVSMYARNERPGATFRLPVPPVTVDVQPQTLTRAELLTELGSFLATFESLKPEAERHINAALGLEPQNAHALVALAQLRMSDKSYGAAETLFAKAITAAPNDGAVALQYAEGLLRDELGPFAETNSVGAEDVARFHKARALAERALTLGADRGRAYGVVGASYIGDPDLTPGIAALQKAHELLPNRPDYALHLAAFYRRTGRIAESDAMLAQLDTLHDPQVSFAARAIVVTLELDRINQLVREQKLDDAITAIHALANKTDDSKARVELERQAQNIESVRSVNAEIKTYNLAVSQSNTGHTRDAMKTLDELLATARDPQVVADAKKLRRELARRRK